MKKKKKFILQVVCSLSILLSIPVFTEANDLFIEHDLVKFNEDFYLEHSGVMVPENTGTSRTAPVSMPGWPVNIGDVLSYYPSGISLADIYGDGLLAIIAGSAAGELHVLNYLGNNLPGWPKTGLEPIRTKAAVADIDPDYPGLEIIVPGEHSLLYIWHNDGTVVSGWPQVAGSGHCKAPVVFDIDGDGDLEIIIGKNNVKVFNHDGTMYPGWPQSTDCSTCVGTPSVADVDNDGVVEICALSWYSVYLWDTDGNIEPGWPLLNVSGESSYTQPTLADLDNDGDLEILHAYYDQWSPPSQNHIAIYHHDGTNFENWPQTYPGPHTFLTPVVGDIDNDGDLEIFGGGHTFDFLAKHHTGENVTGWPVQIGTALDCSPIVFDIDDDGNRDIVIAESGAMTVCDIYAFHGDGSIVADWPIPIPEPALVNSAAVGDVDGDGDIEIALLTMDGSISLWTLEDVPYRSYLTEWGTYYHDNWNTGWFHPKAPQELTYESSGSSVTLDWNENSEPDIAGYNVYRSDTEGGPYTKLNSNLITGTSYNYISDNENNYYCITAKIYGDAESRLSTEVFGQTGVNDELIEPIISLSNYPNPFNPTTTISFSVTQTSPFVNLKIFNLKGQKVKQLVNETLPTGQHSIVWNGTDDNDQPVSSGIYFYKIQSGDFSATEKMILMK